MPIQTILDEFRRLAQRNTAGLGNRFERLTAAYLRLDPLYAQRFSDVWMWNEWPDRWGSDDGIDLVAKERESGKYVAIQCKFFAADHRLDKKDIDSFFTASGKTFQTPGGPERFSERLIFSTTESWTAKAETAIQYQEPPVTRIDVCSFDESPIDWGRFSLNAPERLELRSKKALRPHQRDAIEQVMAGFAEHDRGKLIMACGTGKTFTALRLAERMAGRGGLVLFLVPSINLLSQALREWTAEAELPLSAFAVCSDVSVGKRNEDEDISVTDLAYPATTRAGDLMREVLAAQSRRTLTVVFSTYHSIQVLSDAQRAGVPEFDLIVCDEAHRTTGVTLKDESESHFVRVHDQEFLRGKKRLYMTATPRLYTDSAKSKAQEAGALLCSMDDEAVYGPQFHRLGFGAAVSAGLLADYKVLVLAVDQQHVSAALQAQLADRNREINLDDAVKIVGCWNGLSKRFVEPAGDDSAPMRRAVAFTTTIRGSKYIAQMFENVVQDYLSAQPDTGALRCEVHHVDGTFNALKRNSELNWIKGVPPADTCRILSNARCLSEGVDVPALDAVLFLNPRDSVVDVVQAVGRVMRTAPGKQYGYVILPISIPAGEVPEEALRDHKRYRVVWQVLQALRAHDDRFNVTVNQIELNQSRPDSIQIIGVGAPSRTPAQQTALPFPNIEAWKEAIYARIVLKCGDRKYWEQWAGDVAQIAEAHTRRLRAILAQLSTERAAFERFVKGLRGNINPSISEDDAIEMLSQHLITRPVFDALFQNYSFAQHNPVSQAMQLMLDALEPQALSKETENLRAFYDSVRDRVQNIDNAKSKQRVMIELYDKFFKQAFPRMAERLGIVYTPVEVVDFIVQSAERALREHFGVGLTDRGVHVLDPFTGTGTFVVRLLQSGLIRRVDLERKYREELHANEIVLLAYYIAAVNVEETYHGLRGGEYKPFDGIVLTDTFQIGEGNDVKGFGEAMFPENNARVKRQRARDIRVVISNPPYSAQQGSENDNNQNLEYEFLDKRIRSTYAAASNAKLKKNLYDSYIRAIRWASDRIKHQGVVAFVTNGSFIDANNMDGLRKTLAQEFSTVYCFNLRGNQRTAGELSRKEGGKVFGSGSRTPVAITLLVKDPAQAGPCRVLYHDIGDYLTREEKLSKVQELGSVEGVPWLSITPNAEGDWINQRSAGFEALVPLGDKAASGDAVFSIYSLGLVTNRDAWAYNFSRDALAESMGRMIDNYNGEVARYQRAIAGGNKPDVDDFVTSDPKAISWTVNLKRELSHGRAFEFEPGCVAPSLYRPFTREWLYFNRRFNERVYQIPRLFPTPEHDNIVISVTGIGASRPFSVLVTNVIPNLDMHEKCQCFPLYRYDEPSSGKTSAAGNGELYGTDGDGGNPGEPDGYVRRHAITDWAQAECRRRFRDNSIDKEDIFYYVYGLLHSPEYRTRFEADLRKMLPRIPLDGDFWGFSRAGRELARLHLNYEAVEPWPLEEHCTDPGTSPSRLFRVEKMAFGKTDSGVDRKTIIYNSYLRLTGIPASAYEYVVNGKSAIEWIMERYAVVREPASAIENDPNCWSSDPRFIIDLVKRVVRVGVETVRIVKGLPKLDLDERAATAAS